MNNHVPLSNLVGTMNPTTQETQTIAASVDNIPAVITNGELQRHECNAFLPPLPPEQFESLKELIRNEGLQVPIVLFDGKIVDGWQRYQICRQLGIEPQFKEYSGSTPFSLCWSLNGSRRQLSKGQLAVLANEMMPRLMAERRKRKIQDAEECQSEEKAKFNTKPSGGEVTELDSSDKKVNELPSGRTRSYVAKLLGVSEASIQMGKELKETALHLYQKVWEENLSLNKALAMAKGENNPPGGSKNPSAGTQKNPVIEKSKIERMVIRILEYLNEKSDEKEASEILRPIVVWIQGHQNLQKELTEPAEKDAVIMSELETKFKMAA